MKIKDPVLISKRQVAIYEVDVDGTKIEVTYVYDLDEEGKGFWEYSLDCLTDDLSEDEIEDLENEFAEVISDIGV
jgi:hypothetical protein